MNTEPSLKSETLVTGRVRLKVEKKERNAAISLCCMSDIMEADC